MDLGGTSIGTAEDLPGWPAYVSRQEAIKVLGVKPQTLYSYVSRGLVRRRVDNGGRSSCYNFQDIQRLKARSLARSGHGPAAANAILDALRPLGVRHLDMPLRAERVWRALQPAKK